MMEKEELEGQKKPSTGQVQNVPSADGQQKEPSVVLNKTIVDQIHSYMELYSGLEVQTRTEEILKKQLNSAEIDSGVKLPNEAQTISVQLPNMVQTATSVYILKETEEGTKLHNLLETAAITLPDVSEIATDINLPNLADHAANLKIPNGAITGAEVISPYEEPFFPVATSPDGSTGGFFDVQEFLMSVETLYDGNRNMETGCGDAKQETVIRQEYITRQGCEESDNRQNSDTRQETSKYEATSVPHSVAESKAVGDSWRTEEQYILAIDVGTTNIRGHVYTKYGRLKGSASKQQKLIQPQPGWFELDPHMLVDNVKNVAHDCISAAGLQYHQITCMGFTTMRATFITWDSETGQPFHNLITWQDLRAADYVTIWNKSYTLRTLNAGAKILHTLMRKTRHLAASVLKFTSKHVTMRLLWVLDNIPEIRKRASEGKVMFGCIETWLLWKLTGGKQHVTDYSCASSTGLYDPFQMEWSGIVCGLLNIPMSILPNILDTSGDFGSTDPEVFGFVVPITAVIADQQGAMFGQCCFEVGDVKCTMGTGTFLDLNTGSKPHASIAGLYPLIGWKIGKELVFIAEGQCADTGNVVEWIRSTGLLTDVAESSDLALSVLDSGGVVFVPAFSGLQAPFNDDKAVTAMFGMNPGTTKAHIIRAILESLAFRFKALYETVLLETKIPLSHVRVDGGVANNDFLVQMMSDLVDQTIDRCQHGDMSCLGAAFLAGLSKGVWKDKEELYSLRQSDKVFQPQHNWPRLKILYHKWENAVHRAQNWYPSSH